MGRPKVLLDELPEGWRDALLALASEGASDVELRATVLDGMSDDLWYRLIKEEPEFSGTIKKCKAECAAWWERNGREALRDKDFSYTGWYMNMKNRFGWRDKHETDINVKGYIKVIEIMGGEETSE